MTNPLGKGRQTFDQLGDAFLAYAETRPEIPSRPAEAFILPKPPKLWD